jgi:hypothetical protein
MKLNIRFQAIRMYPILRCEIPAVVEHKDSPYCLLGYDAMWNSIKIPKLRKKLLVPSSEYLNIQRYITQPTDSVCTVGRVNCC